MATVEVRDVQGEVTGTRELPAELFEAPVNTAVMYQVVVAGAALQRAGTHSTKTRGEVSGGGVKPWRQKGTGRARQGSIRAPHWTGGGVAHGPKPRDHAKRVNKKMRRLALRSALTDAAASGKLAAVQGLAFDGPRTKDAVAIMRALDLRGNVLLVLPAPDEAVERSFRNLPEVRVVFPGNLSTFDVLYADRVVFTAEALDALSGEPATLDASSGEPPASEASPEESPASDASPGEPPASDAEPRGTDDEVPAPEELGHEDAEGEEKERLDQEAARTEEAGE
jgi:large subunit ribosomal protein L4